MALPPKEALLSLIELTAQSPEAAEYLCVRFKAVLEKEKAWGECKGLWDKLVDLAEKIQQESVLLVNPWAGDKMPTPFQNREQHQAAAALPTEATEQVHQIVNVLVQINKDSRFERHYTAEGGGAVDDATREQMDNWVRSWLAEQEMVRRNHVIYEADPEGNPRKTDDGAIHVVPPAKIEEKLKDSQMGLAHHVEKQSRGAIQVGSLKIQEPAAPAVERETNIPGA